MMTLARWTVALSLCLTSIAVSAADPLVISNAWARATRPGQEVSAAYMTLKSNADLTLTHVESSAADVVEIHSMSMQNGVMEMRMLDTLALPAGKTVRLEPGGLHLMLFDLKQPLAEGRQIEFLLHLKEPSGRTQLMKISVPVRKSAP